MIEINLTELKKNIQILGKLIEEYNEIELNLFNQLKESCINWQDGNSIKFDSNVQLDKRETEVFISFLLSKKNVFDYIYDKYVGIGKKISCNLNNRYTLLNTIDTCYNKCQNIIDEFNNIDRSFYYTEQSSITYQKSKIIGVKKSLSEMRSSVTKMFNNIENIEKDVNSKIRKLKEIKINSFDFVMI